MRISVGRENLKWVAEVASKVVNLKSPKEELRCVRIEAKAGKAFVQATNLEEWLTIPLDGAEIEAEGACVVNLAELRAFVKDAQPKNFIAIESDRVAVKAMTEISGISIPRGIKSGSLEDWPEFPKRPAQMDRATGEFLEAIRKAIPSTASKDFRRALACVYVSEGLAVATDGHHLTALPCASPFGESVLVKPSKLLESGHINGDCQVGLDLPEKGRGGKLTVVTDSLMWTTSLSDADYPNWRQVVPSHKAMELTVLFDAKSAKEFLRAIPALKSNESAIGLRCSIKDGVFAGSNAETAAFLTEAKFSRINSFSIELSAANLSRALELGLYELKMTDAFSPVLFRDERGGFMASMPLRMKTAGKASIATSSTTPTTPQKEEVPMTKQNVKTQQTSTQSNASTASQGFTVTKPQAEQSLDPFEELMKSAEDVKAAARTSYEAASQFARKLKDVQASLKRKDKEFKSTREIIEKLKMASGF